MLSAGSGYRGSGFLLRLLPGLHRAWYERLCGGLFSPSTGWPVPGSLRCVAVWVRGHPRGQGVAPGTPQGCDPRRPLPLGLPRPPLGRQDPFYSAAP